MERRCAQLQDSGAPKGYRRKEPFKKKGAITMEGSPQKPARGLLLPLYAAERFPEKSVFRGIKIK